MKARSSDLLGSMVSSGSTSDPMKKMRCSRYRVAMVGRSSVVAAAATAMRGSGLLSVRRGRCCGDRRFGACRFGCAGSTCAWFASVRLIGLAHAVVAHARSTRVGARVIDPLLDWSSRTLEVWIFLGFHERMKNLKLSPWSIPPWSNSSKSKSQNLNRRMEFEVVDLCDSQEGGSSDDASAVE